jgi:hypothetical protein
LEAFGAEKLQETMAAFLRALPALRQAGHELREFEIELGLQPIAWRHARTALDRRHRAGRLRLRRATEKVL